MKTILANGCFDGLHYGHVVHLQQARKMGDTLVVAVTVDDAVNKGPERPKFNQFQRVQVLRELRCVDAVILVHSSLEALKSVHPHVFIKGPDYVDGISPEDRQFCERYGIEIHFTTGPKYSSREIFK